MSSALTSIRDAAGNWENCPQRQPQLLLKLLQMDEPTPLDQSKLLVDLQLVGVDPL